ncbi:MAG: metallophosphoesterase [Desulfobacterales bacterium]|nr:metallophosphoesterase [Desulfobacterales bacterium]
MLRVLHRIALVALISSVLLSCGPSSRVYQAPPEALALASKAVTYPKTSFVVITDPHVYDPALGVTGSAFQAYLDKDRKLLKESEELFDAAIDRAATEEADFVIICGDMTKDGEKNNHLMVAEKLKRFQAAGKSVFVVPGNHDVANGEAVRFVGDHSEPIPSVTGAEFADIYRDFGYNAALDRDPASLSYLAEPVPGLWLLAVDSCKWKDNRPGHHAITGGAYSPETFGWIEATLMRARQQGKAVIVFQHHGIMEHYPHNAKFYGDYLVDDHDAVAEMLSTFGVSLVFTGHFHAQDISRRVFDEGRRTIYDIETGSLVTSPCPYRRVRVTDGQKAVIDSRFIDAIPSHPTDFKTYAADYVYQGTIKLADEALIKYKVSEPGRVKFNPQVSRAYVTHLKGDEKARIVIDTDGAGLWGKFVMFMQEDLLYGWTTDLPPADNRLTIDLTTGKSE